MRTIRSQGARCRFFRRLRLFQTIPLTTILLAARAPLQMPPMKSVWDAVYTAAQAERGRVVYEARCSRCHAADLRGVNGASLTGDTFMLHWEGRAIDRLVRRIHDTMPPDAAGTISATDAVDIATFVLQRNGFPDGQVELGAEPAVLAGIQIRSGAGPAVVRNGALVQATGCLRQDRARGWELNGATELEITTLDPAPANHREALRRTPGGARTIALINVFPNPAAHQGHTMRATGFLIREPAGDRLNVVKLEMIEPGCPSG